jgi:hypothetical protein
MSHEGPTSAALVPALERLPAAAAIPPPLATRPAPAALVQVPGREAAYWMTSAVCSLMGVTLTILLGGRAIALLGLQLGFLAGAGLFRLADAAAPAWQRFQIRRVPRAARDSLGSVVRLVGTVQPNQAAFTLAEHRGPLVYARIRYLPMARGLEVLVPGHEEVRGVRFRVETDDHLTVLVDPQDVSPIRKFDLVTLRMAGSTCHALGVPTNEGRSRKYQVDVMMVGQRVELVGRLEREVVSSGSAAPGRGVPTELLLRPAWPGGVWVWSC